MTGRNNKLNPAERELIRRVTDAALDHAIRYLVFWGLIGFAAAWLLTGIISPTDSTDAGRWNRSGMEIKTDAATGCEYLATRMGLTPRMAADGSQMGCRS